MERGLAVHAGAPRKELTRWLARAALVAGAVLATATADAAPKRRDARVAFDRGVAAYQKGDFAAAADALGTSFKIEADPETLFAWAQAERQQEHCDRALELFGTLLDFEMPAENKRAVQAKIDECKAIMAAQRAKEPDKQPEKQPERQADKQPERQPDKRPPPEADPPARPLGGGGAPSGPEGGSPWWKDPIGDSLVIAGVAGLGVGAYFLIAGNRAEVDSKKNYWEFGDLDAEAKRDGKIGVIALGAGGALVLTGIVRYATRGGGDRAEHTTVSGWLTPTGGGLTALGRF